MRGENKRSCVMISAIRAPYQSPIFPTTIANKPNPIIIDKNVKIGLPARQAEFSENSSKSFNFTGGSFVASINGKNYYPKDCPSAKRIKEENMIWFDSAEEAEADGYTPAKNCP